jgi:DNA mismatch repair protein MutL
VTEITRLDDATVSKIAAGEVIERPASVVKELIENALDAGAERIEVTVAAGGTDLIRVRDDGEGMTEDGVKRAVEQHTTSKIDSIEDLEAGVASLGFRGEALHTIGAVSRMTIETRPSSGEPVGTELRVEGGELTDVAPTGRAPGTTVTVADLFFNTPARRKYLKREATEFRHVNRVVSRYALANPDVAVSLTHGDREVFRTPGDGDLEGAVLAVYGRDVAESMIAVEATPDGPIEGISGLVSEPETTRSGSEYVSTYVNGRYVRDEALRSAILSAYGKQLAADRYPFAVLFLSVPPGTVDVNVHPRKMAVRFDDEAAVSEAVRTAVKDALLDHGLIRKGAPRGASAPEETTVEPDTPAGTEDTEQSESGTASSQERSSSSGPDVSGGSETDPARGADRSSQDASPGPFEDDATDLEPADERSASEPGSKRATLPDRSEIDVEPPQTDLTGARDAVSDLETESLPQLRVLGQLDDTYVVAESETGLVLIDQHAADERINYERLRAELADRTETQRLVDPVRLSLTPGEATAFEALEAVETWGFEANVEDGALVVTGVPAVFEQTLEPELLRDLLTGTFDRDVEADLDSAADSLLADMACYPSITGHTSLTEGSVLDLLRALDDCENPYACPHGRPTILSLTIDELEDRFERDYPGHGHRRD